MIELEKFLIKFLIRELVTVDQLQYEKSTVKRQQAWSQIEDILDSIVNPKFRVNKHSVGKTWRT